MKRPGVLTPAPIGPSGNKSLPHSSYHQAAAGHETREGAYDADDPHNPGKSAPIHDRPRDLQGELRTRATADVHGISGVDLPGRRIRGGRDRLATAPASVDRFDRAVLGLRRLLLPPRRLEIPDHSVTGGRLGRAERLPYRVRGQETAPDRGSARGESGSRSDRPTAPGWPDPAGALLQQR